MSNRKTFLRKAAVALAGAAVTPVLTRRPADAADDRYAVLLRPTEAYAAVTSSSESVTAGKYVLVVDGVSQGLLYSVAGGNITTDVIKEKIGPDILTTKHIGSPKVEDVKFKCGLDTPSALSDWLKAALNKSASSAKDVGVIAADYNGNEVAEHQFTHALITEISFPACDASSKDAAYLQVTFAPQTEKHIAANKGKSVATGGGFSKTWIPSNFRLAISGVDCSKVSKIETITWKGATTTSSAGAGAPVISGYAAAGGGNVSNLVVSVAESRASDFLAWQKAATANIGTSATKSGKLDS